MLASLLLASLACNMPANNAFNQAGEPLVDEVATQAAQSTQPSGLVTITITEDQLNAILQQSIQFDPSQSVQDVQTRFQDGQIIITGAVTQQGLRLSLNMIVSVSPDGQGGVQFNLTSASVGPFPLPESTKNQIESILNQNLQSQVRELTNNIYIENIVIGNGVITVAGYAR
jgi:uncharacterized protein YpmS